MIDDVLDTAYSSAITNSSGTLCVAVDDQGGGPWNDEVSIDHVYVVTTP